jgi:ABC-type multidrug transport system permease subunit
LIAIPYFAVNLNDTAGPFFYTYLAAVLVSWMSSSYGLLLSVSFSDAEVAMGLVPILIIPFMLVGGFFAPLQNVHDFYKVF